MWFCPIVYQAAKAVAWLHFSGFLFSLGQNPNSLPWSSKSWGLWALFSDLTSSAILPTLWLNAPLRPTDSSFLKHTTFSLSLGHQPCWPPAWIPSLLPDQGSTHFPTCNLSLLQGSRQPWLPSLRNHDWPTDSSKGILVSVCPALSHPLAWCYSLTQISQERIC